MRSSKFDPTASAYIRWVRRCPKLSREEEHRLAVAALEGDAQAANRLAEANLRYVVAIAVRYRRHSVQLSELISEGNLGLVTAVQKFDPERGTRFVTYAGYWIRAFILDLIVRSTTMVGAGAGPFGTKVFFRLRRERARISNFVSDRDEKNRLLAARFGIPVEQMELFTHRIDHGDMSLDAPVYRDSTMTLLDTLTDPQDSDQETEAFNRQRDHAVRRQLEDALAALDERERFIVEQRYLVNDAMSLAALGRMLGVSRERARQLEIRAKRKLKKQLRGLEQFAVDP
ncbi:MAG: sigma-70 family RNA polymerase sigma factor [Myxococcota bacterium]